MFQRTSGQNEARKCTAKDWEDMKSEIAGLYESGTLESVMKFMREKYGFDATPKQYKDRIGKWGLNKNIHQGEMEAMIWKREERQSESNKQTAFRLRGRPVNERKIERYVRDHPKQLATGDSVDMDRNMSMANTPADISYYTPSDFGPLSPQDAPNPHIESVPPQGIRGFYEGTPQGYDSQYSEGTTRPKPLLNDQNYPERREQLQQGGSGYPGSRYHGGYGGPLPQYPFQPNHYPTAQGNYGRPPPPVSSAFGYGYHQPPAPQHQFEYPKTFQQHYAGYSGVPGNSLLYGRPAMPAVNSIDSPNAPAPPPQGTRYLPQDAPQGPRFQYSTCTGRRKALLIGINYFGQRGQLRGCINDVKNMTAFLNDCFGYKRDDMVILTDCQQNPMSQPTKQNVLRAMHWLVKDSQPNDSLFFHFSGHGGQTKGPDGDEGGYDEVIYPVDFRRSGHIVDNEMHRILVQPLQAGVRLTAIFDSVHSGTTLDLPYIYSTPGISKEPNSAKEAGQGLLGVISANTPGDLGAVANDLMGFFKKATQGDDAYNKTMAAKTSGADVVMLSGCRDDKTSANATVVSQATGAMSWAFINALKKNRQQSYAQLLKSIHDELAEKYTQKPQLSCSHPLNTNLLFVL